jgi:hypothetical protein
VNYKTQIEALKEKGIFSQEQAQRLSDSFEKKAETKQLQMKRYYTLEIVGAGLIGFVLLYIFMTISSTTHTNIVEDIAISLNAPVASGISTQNSFILLVILLLVIAYGVLYFYAHNRFRMFWHTVEEIAVTKAHIHHIEVMKKELNEELEKLLSQEKEPKYALLSSTIRNDVAKTYKEIEILLLGEKEQLQVLQEKCLKRQKYFPNSLAKLVGKLPTCQ